MHAMVNALSLANVTFDDDDPEANNNLNNDKFKQGTIHIAY